MKTNLLFRVAESRPLTGLGVLLFPAEPPETLGLLELHTSLQLMLVQPDKQEISATASVEEVTRTGQPAVRALLLTQEGAAAVPVGTEVWTVAVNG
ncbi:hypothetical protein [Hymenobacter actinosclerus]|uniref:Uncharacterized protein n=1 Tax=Hymenobacter actinosclerus TaxID=82805 RepID=A0A1I0A8S9_9BACT|nr:hypothetical protein [Hymenobacter actinosclerus]SES90543.1 hypothetical protein SAMN04487998_0627 [Hymenobacter actinosclerus]